MNVLLVDDEPLVLDQLEYMIQAKFPNWKVSKAYDSFQALEISRERSIQLTLLDINMPGKTGLELGRELQQHDPKIEMIIVTAHQDFHYAKQSIKLGVVDYLTKPVIESELIHVLDKYKHVKIQSSYSPIIQDALHIIHEKYAEKLNLVDISSAIHINSTYLSRRFSEEVGVSFSEYLIHYRVEMSKKALVNHFDWSISMVAEMTGFNSQHYFCTIFRKIVGTTPKEYRKKVN